MILEKSALLIIAVLSVLILHGHMEDVIERCLLSAIYLRDKAYSMLLKLGLQCRCLILAEVSPAGHEEYGGPGGIYMIRHIYQGLFLIGAMLRKQILAYEISRIFIALMRIVAEYLVGSAVETYGSGHEALRYLEVII